MFTKFSLYKVKPGQIARHDEAAARAVAAFAVQSGFRGRVLARNAEDASEYLEVVQWASSSHGEAAFEHLSADDDVRRWLSYIDLATLEMTEVRAEAAISRAEASLSDERVGAWMHVRWNTKAGVDDAAHTRGGILLHHEVFAHTEGYQGAIVYRAPEVNERMELVAWADVDVGKRGLGAIIESGNELVSHHLSDCAPGATIRFLLPVVRS